MLQEIHINDILQNIWTNFTFPGLDHLGCNQVGNLPENKNLDAAPVACFFVCLSFFFFCLLVCLIGGENYYYLDLFDNVPEEYESAHP